MSKNIFILTGAGVSAGAGLPTYRDKGGLWDRHVVEKVGSLSGYERDPAGVLDFYNGIRRDIKAEPCAAHLAIAKLDAEWPGRVTVCTQNVDGLHQRAGSRHVIAMHGDLATDRCHVCGAVTAADGDLTLETVCRACGRKGVLRPNLVWFGELPQGMECIDEALNEAGMFVAIGTSGEVYPASSLVDAARQRGVSTLLLNRDCPSNANAFDAVQYGEADEIVPLWVDEMFLQIEGGRGAG
jgi:NAD-dependent deacetylase